MNPIVSTLIKGMLYLILKAKQGGKYLDRKKVVDRKTGKMRYKYKYKPMQQRAAHEVTRNKFEKVTKLSGDEHKNQIEHALQNGIHVSLHVLRDYPDLAVKYHQQARLAKADKIRAKVKTHKEKERMEREVRLNTPEGLKNNPIKLEAERMMREDGLIKDVPVSDNREVENNFDTMPESKPEPAKLNKDSLTNSINSLEPQRISELLEISGEDKASVPRFMEGLKRGEFQNDIKNEFLKDVESDIEHTEQELAYYQKQSDKNKTKKENISKQSALLSALKIKKKQIEDNALDYSKVSKFKLSSAISNVHRDFEEKSKLVEPEPAKNTDLKANFESWKEERKTAASAFKLEQKDITSKEKNTRFNDAQGGLFGKKPVTHESFANKDFKPALALEGNETITSLVTAVKSALMREGLDTRAREFVDKALKEKDINSLKKLASEYVELKNNAQVSNPSTENKGSEEKTMSQLKGKDMPIEGQQTIHERFYENNGYYVDISVVDKKPTIWIGNGSNKKEVSPSAGGDWWIEEPDKFMTKKLKESGAKPSNYISVSGSPVRKEAKAAIESAIKRFEELKNQDPFEQKWTERRRLEKLKFPSGKIEEIENSLEDDRRGFNKFMESEEDYSKLKTSKYTNADLEAEYAKYPKFVAHRKLKNSTDRTIDPDELGAIYAKMAELEKS